MPADPKSLETVKKPFWSLPISEVLNELHTTEQGLSDAEAQKRYGQYGENSLVSAKPRSTWSIFFSQFSSPLIIILLLAGVVTIFLEDYHDALFILLAAFFNAALGFYQENKAEKAVEHLSSYLKSRVRVTRGGAEREIETLALVPGDIIRLTQGDRVPADARIIHSTDVRVDQAVLTGESLPVEKDNREVATETSFGDRRCMLFAGTLMTEGICVAVVTATDDHTEFGSIAKAVSSAGRELTPLQKALKAFTLNAAFAILVMTAGLFVLAISTGTSVINAFLVAVAILVAAVPEGLPIVTTVILAIGVERLAKRKGIVRRLSAAETLGSTTIILTDKTGTLTQAIMSLGSVTVVEPELAIKESISQEAFLFHIALLNVDALIENPTEHHSDWKISGKPLEVALIKAAASHEVHLPKVRQGMEALHVLPFSSLHKFSASLYKMPATWYNKRFKAKEPYVLSLLGAPDILLKLSDVNVEERGRITSLINSMAAKGERIIGVAVKEVESVEGFHFNDQSHIKNLRFLGLLAFIDPLRPGAKDAIKRVQEAGLRVIVLTGDHEETAAAIARELGLGAASNQLLKGIELDVLTDEELSTRLKTIDVIARVSPAAKLRVVKLLQASGEVVAMTGDGINDAPALREADIGIAMGSGTDVSQDVADLILLDNNFETIVSAMHEGRRILSNLRKAIVFLTSTLLNEIVLIGGSLIAGVVNPINALQILWINILTESTPAIALAFEKNVDTTRGHAQRPSRSVFTNEMKYMIAVHGALSSLLLFSVYYLMLRFGVDPAIARTFTYACLGTYSLFVVASFRNLKASILSYNPFANLYLTASVAGGFALTMAGVYIPFFQKYFETVSLPPLWFLGIIAFGLVNIFLVEMTKLLFRNEIA